MHTGSPSPLPPDSPEVPADPRPAVTPPAQDPAPVDDAEVAAAKTVVRRRLAAGRRARTDAERESARAAIADHLIGPLSSCRRVAAYLPLPTEPLPASFAADLAATGVTVLVPVVTGASPLDWALADGPVTTGARGITEPTGPRLGADAVRSCDVVLVPALAVDVRGGRLGRGGGHYDRTLAPWPTAAGMVRPRLIAVVFDDEVLDRVPTDALDRPVDAVVTPGGGLRDLSG